MSEVVRRAATASRRREDRWDDAAAAGLSVLDALVYRSNLLGVGPRARQPGRRQHVREGNGSRSRRPRAARALGQGLRHRPRDDHGRRASPACASTSSCRCANARRWTTRRWSTTCCVRRSRPISRAVDRDAAARVHPGGARRPHASRRDHRADLVARRGAGSPRTRSATRRSGSTTSVPGFDMSKRIAELLDANPVGARRPAREARARHLGRHRRRRATATRSSSSRACRASARPSRPRSVRAGRPEGRGARGGGRGRPPRRRSLPALRGALLADADGVVLEVDRSPEAVAFASSARAPR